MTPIQMTNHAKHQIEVGIEAAEWTINNPWGSSYMTTVRNNMESAHFWLREAVIDGLLKVDEYKLD
jgi:hypothetical protein